MCSHPVNINVLKWRHIPIFIIKALFTSLLGLNDIFRYVSLSVEFRISFPKSYPFKLGKFARPNSTNYLLERVSMPAEVTPLQKFM
jgi:hypothetical protein